MLFSIKLIEYQRIKRESVKTIYKKTLYIIFINIINIMDVPQFQYLAFITKANYICKVIIQELSISIKRAIINED